QPAEPLCDLPGAGEDGGSRRQHTEWIVLAHRVTFCGAGGLGVLIGIQGRARSQGITLALTGVSPSVGRLLRITGLDQRFPIMA
ncbi:anti-sigma factor antagonist, partial [Nonomuraea deserti]